MSWGGRLISGALAIQSGRLAVSASTPVRGRNAGHGSWAGWARCWVLKAQVLPGLLGQTGIASYRLSHSLLVGGLGLVAVWVLGLFVF